MAEKYTRSIANDFPNQKVTPCCLKKEIDGSSITPALIGIHTAGDDCDCWFETALSSGDETTFDGLVAAHQAPDLKDATQTVTSGAEDTTTETDYQNKVTLNSDPLIAGTYLISWNFEVRLTDGGLGCGLRTQVECDSAERSEDNWEKEFWHHNNGSAIVDFEDGDTPVIEINYKVVGSGDTARIRRARLSLMRAT